MELLKLYTALLRRFKLVAASVVLYTALGVAMALLLPKNYEASSRVLVSTSDTSMSILSELGLSEVAMGLSSSDDQMANVIALATTRPVLDELIWKLQLRNSDGKLLEMEEVLVAGLTGELEARANLEVTQQQGTDILVFTARTDDPELARLMADTAVAGAIAESQRRAKQDTQRARLFIEEQLGIVRGEFDRAMGEMASAQASEEILDLDAEMKAAIARLSELMLSFEENAALIQEVRGKIESQRAFQEREAVGAVGPGTVAQNARVKELQERLVTLRAQRASELVDKTEQNPDIVRIDRLLSMTEAELGLALDEQHLLDPTVQQLQAQLAGLVSKGLEINEAIGRTTEKFGAYPDKMRRLSQLQLAAEAAEEVYKSLQEQTFQIGVAQAMLVSELQPIDPAKAPDKQSSPKLVVNIVLGLLVGSAFGLGLAFLLEYIDDSVKTPEDVAEVWPIARLGMIPRFKLDGDRRVIDTLPVVHPVSEAYRGVRRGLLYASLDKTLQVLAVSSSVPGEGKSTAAVNLAIAIAREGKRVVLVDCDLRRPVQHRSFPMTANHRGLTEVLTRQVGLEEALQATSVEGLRLLASGAIPADPGRLVESARLGEVIEELRGMADVIIIDTPPALVVTDAMAVATKSDGILLVVEAGKTSRRLLADLRLRFEAAKVEPLGLVVNKLDFASAGYGHYAKAYKAYLPSSTKGGGAT